MPEENEKSQKINPLKNPEEWLEPVKWLMVFVSGIIFPLFLLSIFWILANPPFKVFLTISIIYTILSTILIIEVVRGGEKD